MGRRIRCVTFDCYGTLIDWHGGLEKALLALPGARGNRDLVGKLIAHREEVEKGLLVSAPILPEEESPDETFEAPEYRPYRQILAESILIAAREIGADLTEAESAAAAATMPAWEPFPDTRRALGAIKEMFPIAILSNVEEEVIRETIRRIGVPFDMVVTAERVGAYKPAPDHWYAAMHELEADEEELFHLAASPFHDLETATLLGIPCGFINRERAPLLAEAKPSFEVPDLASAVDRLRGYAQGRRSSAAGARTEDRSSAPSRRAGFRRTRPRR